MILVGLLRSYQRVKTLTDASVWNCKGDISAFRPSIMVGIPGRVFVRALLLSQFGEPNHESHFQRCYIYPGSCAGCAAHKYLRFVESKGYYWRPTAISRDTQESLITALVTMTQGLVTFFTCSLSDMKANIRHRYRNDCLAIGGHGIFLKLVNEKYKLNHPDVTTPPSNDYTRRR